MLDCTPDPIGPFHVSKRLDSPGTSHSHMAMIFLLDCIWEAQEAPQRITETLFLILRIKARPKE